MLLLLSTILLYLVQLVYAIKRWFFVTSQMIADARQSRMRRAIDWNA